MFQQNSFGCFLNYVVLNRSLSSTVFCPKLKYKSIVLKHLFLNVLSILIDHLLPRDNTAFVETARLLREKVL